MSLKKPTEPEQKNDSGLIRKDEKGVLCGCGRRMKIAGGIEGNFLSYFCPDCFDEVYLSGGRLVKTPLTFSDIEENSEEGK